MIGPSKYLELSSTANVAFVNCAVHLSVLRRQLEIHFDMSIPNTNPESYKIIIPLKFIAPDSFVVNRLRPELNCQAIFFEMTVAPQVWKKSLEVDTEDLKDRLQWSESEQWIRQCDISGYGADSSLSATDTRIIMKNILLPVGTGLSFFDADIFEDAGKRTAFV